MKKRIFLQLILCSLFFLTACSVQKEGTTSQKPKEKEKMEITELTTHLRTYPGVDVRGRGQNAAILIRGVKSLINSHEPLFVLNGLPVNGGYFDFYNVVDITLITKILVKKSGPELAMYGTRGANGVIEVYY